MRSRNATTERHSDAWRVALPRNRVAIKKMFEENERIAGRGTGSVSRKANEVAQKRNPPDSRGGQMYATSLKPY
jgi:hypothetical protein